MDRPTPEAVSGNEIQNLTPTEFDTDPDNDEEVEPFAFSAAGISESIQCSEIASEGLLDPIVATLAGETI